MSLESDQTSADEREVNRRALLRRGGFIVAATVAGATAVEALTPGTARAASGDALTIGTSNDADADPTVLTSSASDPTFTATNTGSGAPLGLAPQLFGDYTAVSSVELTNLDGFLYSATDFGGGDVEPGFVYTEFVANQVVAIIPTRILDTRGLGPGTDNVVDTTGKFDSHGRLIGGKSIIIDLSPYEFLAEAVFANLTVVSPTAVGFLTLSPTAVTPGTKPSTSSINYTAGQVLANFAVTGTDTNDTIAIYADSTTHVLLDVLAFNVGNIDQINPEVLPAATASPNVRRAGRTKTRTAPSWYHGNRTR